MAHIYVFMIFELLLSLTLDERVCFCCLDWMILMKGVAGVPGDLYNLWSTSRTENQNVPEAIYLTSTYPGHYKPDLSNYWSSLCIDKVAYSVILL